MDKGVHTIHSVVVAFGNRKKEAGSEADSRCKCSRDGCLILIFLGPKLRLKYTYVCMLHHRAGALPFSLLLFPSPRERKGQERLACS